MDSSLLAMNATDRAQAAYADSLQAHTAAALGARTDKAHAAAQEFEAFFVGQMMEYMSAGIKSDGVFGGGQAEDTWRSMLNQEYGKQIAKSGRLGIADMVMKGMVQAQEKREAAVAASANPETAADPSAISGAQAAAARGAARYARAAAL
jgi:Rod binding domain-containing protein